MYHCTVAAWWDFDFFKKNRSISDKMQCFKFLFLHVNGWNRQRSNCQNDCVVYAQYGSVDKISFYNSILSVRV